MRCRVSGARPDTAACGHEARQAGDALAHGARLDRHHAAAVVVADDRILVGVEPVELRVDDPGLLDELELTT